MANPPDIEIISDDPYVIEVTGLGCQGLQGIQGEKGDTGDTGPQGIQGDQGIQGIQGIQGEKGDTGDTGPVGPAGAANTFAATNVTANYTVLATDIAIRASNTVTVTMLTAVGIEGQFFRIKNVGTGAVTLATTLSQTIDGFSTFSLLAGEAAIIRSNNVNWEIW